MEEKYHYEDGGEKSALQGKLRCSQNTDLVAIPAKTTKENTC